MWPVSSPTIAGGMILCQGLDDMGWDQFGYCGIYVVDIMETYDLNVLNRLGYLIQPAM